MEERGRALAPQERELVLRLAGGVLAARPLIDVLEAPIHVAGGGAESAPPERLLNAIASRAGTAQFAAGAAASDLTLFEKIIDGHLRANGLDQAATIEMPEDWREIDQVIGEALRNSFARKFDQTEVRSFDGAVLNVYSAGRREKEPVIILSACGMPAKLSEKWMNVLARDHFVITWETRGLFDATGNFDALSTDTPAQAADVFAVMDHAGIDRAHLMGLCGGAVVALRAVETAPERVSGMTLCYGDFDFGAGSQKTVYQRNLKGVMDLAGAGRADAASIYGLFCDSMVKSARADLAHLILYPFANAELLYRYARLNSSIMNERADDLLKNVSCPALIITSEDDNTAHPDGSRQVAARIPGAILRVEPHGDHLSFYEANEELNNLVASFASGGRMREQT